MHTQSRQYKPATLRHARRLATIALSAALLAVLAVIPTGSAVAAPTTPSVTTIPVVSTLTLTELNEVLSKLPVGALNSTQLSEVLAKLPGIEGLVPSLGLGGLTDLKTALPAAIADLVGKNATLGQLLEPTGLPSTLGTELGKLLPLLTTLLGGNPATKLTEALGSKTPTELVDSLLGSATEPAKLSQLLNEIAAGLSPTDLKTLLQTLLGSTMTGGFALDTVEGAAKTLGATTESLTKTLESATKEVDLPATTQALTAPLDNGSLLTLLDGLGGLSLNVLGSEKTEETGKETGKETTKEETNKEGGKETTNKETSKETGGSGSSGGSGGSSGGPGGSGSSGGSGGSSGGPGGSGGNPGATTVVVDNPLTQSPGVTPPAVVARTVGKLEIISHRVKGRVATIVVQVPTVGKLTLSGSGVRAMNRQVDHSERVTLRVRLSRAGASSLRTHHRLKVRLLASFKPSSGSSSSAGVTVAFA